jgi:hypothetical protein
MVERPPEPADDDSTKARRRHRLTWRRVGIGLFALVLLVVVLLTCILWIPKWLYPSLTQTDLQNVSDAAKVQEFKAARLKLQNDARSTLLQGLGAVLVLTGAAIGASVTLRQVQATRDQLAETATANRKQQELTERGQVTDRYTKAIDQLDSKALTVRLGGLYALERIAQDSPDDRPMIAEVLCAYARTAPRPKPPARRVKDRYGDMLTAAAPVLAPVTGPASLTVRAPDVQSAVTILGRWQDRLGEPPPDLDLHGADLQGARLEGAQLQKANLTNARLEDAWLQGAQLQGAKLEDARLQGAILHRAQLQGAVLSRAELQEANLSSAQLQEAVLNEAKLQETDLSGADLRRARLGYTELQGADLSGAQLQDAILTAAQASEETQWPEGWDDARFRAAGVTITDGGYDF